LSGTRSTRNGEPPPISSPSLIAAPTAYVTNKGLMAAQVTTFQKDQLKTK
jgi:hypothetical protein